ncbi:MAG: DUF6043 family protein [Dysgonomonas sp.]|nr:DUF6043 family protein [Dysgonomonas sp.]
MGQQEFESFKQNLKDWMDSHQDEYDLFEEEMNRKDSAGYQMIMSKAMSILPQYEKIIKQRINKGKHEDITDIETLFQKEKLAQSLIEEFNNPPRESIVPSMLCWLYFGQSFERMIEKGQELKLNPETSYFQKIFISYTIKLMIKQSVKLGLRTNEDWKEYNKLKKVIENNEEIDWAMEEETIENVADEKKKAGRKKIDIPFPELLMPAVSDKEGLIKRIEEHITIKHTELDLAYLKIALEELAYMFPCDVKLFRNALEKQYGEKVHIIGERGIQNAHKRLTSYIKNQLVKDTGEDRQNIENLKKFLSL